MHLAPRKGYGAEEKGQTNGNELMVIFHVAVRQLGNYIYARLCHKMQVYQEFTQSLQKGSRSKAFAKISAGGDAKKVREEKYDRRVSMTL